MHFNTVSINVLKFVFLNTRKIKASIIICLGYISIKKSTNTIQYSRYTK